MHLLVQCQGCGSPFMGENGSCLCVMHVKLLLVKRHSVSVRACVHAGLYLFAFLCVRTSAGVCICEISLYASMQMLLYTCTDG